MRIALMFRYLLGEEEAVPRKVNSGHSNFSSDEVTPSSK